MSERLSAEEAQGSGKFSSNSFLWQLRAAADAGLSQAGLDALRARLQAQIDEGRILGTVTAVARRNQLVFHEAQGWRDPLSLHPLPVDGLFRMMSSTKSVTAVAVLVMQDEGRLDIDDPVSRFIPSFKAQRVAIAPPGTTDPDRVQLVAAKRELTIKDLLTHTGGLSSSSMAGLTSVAALVNKVERRSDDTLASYVERLGALALDFEPGSRWAYSATDGFDTLLRVVEVAGGQPAEVVLAERIFQPLGMRDTHFNVPDDKRERIVPLHTCAGDAWQAIPSMFGDGPYSHVSGAGNLFSTARDFLHYELMLLNQGSLNGRRVLSPEGVRLLSSNQVGSRFAEVYPDWTGGHGFGLGVAVVEDPAKGMGRAAGSFGWGGAYGTVTWCDPAQEMAVVSMVQQPGANLMSQIGPALQQAQVAET
ncbi:MAG TPA: serine hydrolase domain-containing protein [Roseateles sp.]|uniref:serine hydrolase domain-containing protein n=1 Tax=Roseateles sp. TaxID=1971397 RepID=UPI002ED79F2C